MLRRTLMKEEVILQLEPDISEYLTWQAAQWGIEESAVVNFALSLLALYRRQTAEGDAVLLQASSIDPAEGLVMPGFRMPAEIGLLAKAMDAPSFTARTPEAQALNPAPALQVVPSIDP
jgi:hypothetical protein